MVSTLTVSGFLILLGALLFLYHKTHAIAVLEQNKKYHKNETLEGVQSIISGLVILFLALILAFFNLSLVLISLLGIALIFSGARVTKKQGATKTVLDLVKDIHFGIIFFLLGLFLIILVLFAAPPPTPSQKTVKKAEKVKEEKAPKESIKQEKVRKEKIKEQDKEVYKKVRKLSYVRDDASTTGKIMGLSIPGAKVYVIKSENGFTYVKGDYKKGKDGRGGKSDGKFWIGNKLLE